MADKVQINSTRTVQEVSIVSSPNITKVYITSINNSEFTNQNNIWKQVFLGYYTTQEQFNTLFNQQLIVSQTENVMLVLVALGNPESPIVVERYKFAKGKGTWLPIPNIVGQDIIFESNSGPTSGDIDLITGGANTQTFELGVIDVESLSDYVNDNGPYDMSDTGLTYLFLYTYDDVNYLYQFIGTNGTYGIGEPIPTTVTDFIFITSSALPPTAPVVNQDNFVRKLDILETDLSGTGTIEEQICEYILLLPNIEKTILETDSKWNVVILDGSIVKFIYEILNKGKGIIEELTPENLLLLKDGGMQTLSETLNNGNVTGGFNILINDADAIELENTSLLKKGTYDFGGDGGISRICSVGFEDMWQSGFRHVFDNNGLIRHSTNCFDVIPDETFDDTLRFKIDSLWTLDNGTTYKCLDASTGAAIWELYSVGGIPTLQEVLDNNHDLVDGNFFAGTGAGGDNVGSGVIAIGANAGGVNSGDNQNALGTEAGGGNIGNNQNALGVFAGSENQGDNQNALGFEAGFQNTGDNQNALGGRSGQENTGNNQNAFGVNAGSYNIGDNQNALGFDAGQSNSGNHVNALGNSAGGSNTYDNVNLFGQNAQADENGQTVLSKDGTIMARISTADLTDTHKYNLPDADGTIALTSDIPAETTRYVTTFVATEGQVLFTVTQPLPIGYFDVFLNGVKINSFTSTDFTVTLDEESIAGDIVDIVSYNVLSLTSRDTRRNATDSVDTNTNYCGVAPNGSLETDEVWTIYKIVVANDGSVTTTSAIDVAWTDREITIYT